MEWYGICELPGANDAACSHFILKLHQSGFLKGDDMTDRFIRCLMVSDILGTYIQITTENIDSSFSGEKMSH